MSKSITKEVTEELVQEAVKTEPHSSGDVGAATYKLTENELEKTVRQLPLKALRRVVLNTTLGPLARKAYALQNDDEKRASYHLLQALMERLVMEYDYLKNLEQTEEKPAPIEVELKQSNEGETTNG